MQAGVALEPVHPAILDVTMGHDLAGSRRLVAFLLQRTQFVPRPRREVFAFFADALNLERITPPFLRFHVETPPPIAMEAGTVIAYRLRLYGVPVRWRSRIEVFDPERSFTDVQVSGPYRSWTHRHDFLDVPGGTEVRDTVRYEVPLGPIGALVQRMFIVRSLREIFDFRREAVGEIFAAGTGGPASAD